MNIEEYISSGVLELYAAGALSAAETADVERLATQYPEIRAELDLILNTMDEYAALHAVNPPATLKNKVLQAVKQHGSSQLHTNNLPKDFAEAPDNGRIIPINRSANQAAASAAFKWLVAASLILLILSNALSFYFYQKWQNSDESLQIALNTQRQYAQNYQRVQQQLSLNQQVLVLLSDANTLRIELKGVEKSPESKVTVYWHRLTKDVYLNVNNLPEPPANKQYQLWALVDGKPLDAGVVNGSDVANQLHHMKDVQQAQAFAITLEPKGGSISPTLEEMYVMGKI
ncbi:hypothetical protein AAE02nite_26710 [Adhaeribacter aerolatus]|uniref:Regulator of SigK n=1 Tax=Adhaeribacter aerolatus TaxID=670289 RepID=A0A512AZQ4_9BACT|nr:anti-sigma factor [Adhaeribacter aerolatus]GEO05007.1 hypothetical protein AAE02nite_26710 [Adhaeribacter aerolatus]